MKRTVMASLLALLGMTLGCGKSSPAGPSQQPIPAQSVSAPTVSLVSPDTGPTDGATGVTITGTGFQSGATVTLDGTATNVVVVSCPKSQNTSADCTAIMAKTPAHSTGTVDVVVTNPGGQSGRLAGGYTYAVISPPTVTAVSTNTGSTGGSTPLRISGTGFQSGATVTFDGIAAQKNSIFQTSTIIDISSTPAHAAGTVDIVVTNPTGQSGRLTGGYTYASPQSFDFNGDWGGYAYFEDEGTQILFTIQNNTLTSFSCGTSGTFTLSPPSPVSNGAFSFVGNNGVGTSGRIVSASDAAGTINIADLAPCKANTWRATRR